MALALQWQMKQCDLTESYKAHRLLTDRVLDDENVSEYCFLVPRERPWKKKHSSHCLFSQRFFTSGWDQQSINFDLQLEEESDFLHAVAIQAGQKFLSNLRRKQIFVVFNDCQDMLQNSKCWWNQQLILSLHLSFKLENDNDFILQPFF